LELLVGKVESGCLQQKLVMEVTSGSEWQVWEVCKKKLAPEIWLKNYREICEKHFFLASALFFHPQYESHMTNLAGFIITGVNGLFHSDPPQKERGFVKTFSFSTSSQYGTGTFLDWF
jgi:hypothetical protein